MDMLTVHYLHIFYFLGFGFMFIVGGVYNWTWVVEGPSTRYGRVVPPVVWTPFKRACARILAVLMGFCLVAAGVVLLLQGISL